MIFSAHFKRPRMWDWILVMLLCLGGVWWFAPEQITVVLYKVSLVSIAACMTYWIDRSLFKRAHDRVGARDALSLDTQAEAMRHGSNVVRRALVFVGCVLGLSLGL